MKGNEETTVVIDSLTTVPQLPSEKSAASYPSLLSFQNELSKSVDGAKLSLKKRRRAQETEAADDDINPELFVETHSRGTWHAQRGFNEVNAHYYVGVLHKPSGKMRLVQVDTVYSLKPHGSYEKESRLWDEIDEAEEHQTDEKDDKKTYWDKRKEFLDAFGGKKSVQSLRKYEKNRITEDKVDEKATEHVSIATKNMLAKDAAEGIHHRFADTTEISAPPHDKNAQDAKDAYPLHGLLTTAEMNELSEAATLVVKEFSQGNAENPGWHPLIWDVLRNLVAQCTTGENLDDALSVRLQCAMHVHYLITLASSPKRMLPSVRSDLLANMAVSENTLVQLLQRFSTPQAEFGRRDIRVRTASDLESIAKYALVMWMHTHGFQNCGRLDELADALGIPIKSCLMHALSIGCKVRKQKDISGPQAYCISLQVPLTFPKMQKRVTRPARRANA